MTSRIFSGRIVNIRIAQRAVKDDIKASAKKTIMENLGTKITIIISVLSFLFSIIQFTYNETMIDVRKYNNSYYEERYGVFKSIASSISKIEAKIKFLNKALLARDSVVKPLSRFQYARLVLDINKPLDKKISDALGTYELEVFELVRGEGDVNKVEGIGNDIISQLGTILRNEKDSINSTHSFWAIHF